MEEIKVLHVSYHQGCIKNLNYIFNELNIKLETQIADWNYNIGHDRAKEIWNKYKDYYNQFDIIITSDTAPLSRIFLQNNFKGKLIIWICNRFDYADQSTNDCNFPDPEYYSLIRDAVNNPKVKIFSYTAFEHQYARKYRNIELGTNLMRPCAFVDSNNESFIPKEIIRENTFFIPQYHNDSIFMNLQSKCEDLGITSYCGRYNGPNDLKDFKGIIHIPYAWSNLALFENWSIGNVYLIPSKDFLLKMSRQHNFWWQDSYAMDQLHYSEWYSEEHKNCHIYFDDWEDLKNKSTDKELLKMYKENVMKKSDIIKNEAISLIKEIIS